MNYLITGGAGFMGSNFLKYMLEKYPEDKFINLDKLTYASNLAYLNDICEYPNYIFIKGDICDKDLVEDLFIRYKINIVVNFAAESHVDTSIEDCSTFYQSNVLGTLNLLQVSMRYNIFRFHQISTDEVYGDLSVDSNYLFTEKDKLNPSNPYSASKASADEMCLAFYRTYNFPVTISRSANNLGPNQNVEKFIPKICSYALQEKNIPIYGYGTNVRDWIYVDDHSAAIELIITKGSVGNIYNISAQNQVVNLDLVFRILKMLNKSDKLIEFVEDRKGHDEMYAMDSSKLEDLGWKPLFTFQSALTRTVEWNVEAYKENESN